MTSKLKSVSSWILLFLSLDIYACTVLSVKEFSDLVDEATEIVVGEFSTVVEKPINYNNLSVAERKELTESIDLFIEKTTGRLGLDVTCVLKGKLKKGDIFSAVGYLTKTRDPNDHKVPYKFVRPAGRTGSCYAYSYHKKALYLFFLKNGTPYWAPLAPVNEEVSGLDDGWVIYVQDYLSSRAEPPAGGNAPRWRS